MLAFGAIVATNALEGAFRPVDLLSDVLRVEIDSDRVITKWERGERPEDPAPGALRTAFEDDEIVIESVSEKSEIPSRLNTLMPAVLMDSFVLSKLSDGLIVVALEVGWVEGGRVVAK